MMLWFLYTGESEKDYLEEITGVNKPEYGKRVVLEISKRLSGDYGSGFDKSAISRMINFYQEFSDYEKVVTLSQQLTWSHFLVLLPIKDEIEELNEEKKMSVDMFYRNPYMLDFLGLKDTYSEKDLENAILAQLEKFILEMGSDFAFLARQKHFVLDGKDYFMDLLFFHRTLRRLVLIELKLGEFEPQDKGQVELYLRWLEKYERAEGEEKPIALILCAEKSQETIELMELDNGSIHVAQYLTKMPPKEVLEKKLLQAIANAKEQLEQREE